MTKWGEKGEFGYELYDHKNDSQELNNLVNNDNYYLVLDSLKKHIDLRIADARKIPEGVGRQLQEVQLRKESYTPGDIHDINGKRIYMKPADD